MKSKERELEAMVTQAALMLYHDEVSDEQVLAAISTLIYYAGKHLDISPVDVTTRCLVQVLNVKGGCS